MESAEKNEVKEVLRVHDKRKVEEEEEEDLIQAKRLREVTAGKKKCSTLHSRKKSADMFKRSHSISSRGQETEDQGLEKLLLDIQPEEVERLRQSLEADNLERHFNCTFWNTLNSNYGSVLGYLFGFLVIIIRNYSWMLEEVADETEGHTVSKCFVVLFVIFGYSFITLGLELVQLVYLIGKIYFPGFCQQLDEEWREHREFIRNHEFLNNLRSSKYFYTPFAVLWSMISAFMGSEIWSWFWWNHICKSYHDRTCKKSWLGKLVIAYRDQACYDGTASSEICERFVSYLPIFIFCVIFVFVGNVFMPLINDWLSTHYPISANLEAAFDLMENLQTNLNKDEHPTGDFTFTKTLELEKSTVESLSLDPQENEIDSDEIQ